MGWTRYRERSPMAGTDGMRPSCHPTYGRQRTTDALDQGRFGRCVHGCHRTKGCVRAELSFPAGREQHW